MNEIKYSCLVDPWCHYVSLLERWLCPTSFALEHVCHRPAKYVVTSHWMSFVNEQTFLAQKYTYIEGASVGKSKHSRLELNFCGPESYWKLKVNTAPLFYSLFRPTDWRASVAYYSRTISQYFCTFWCFLSENEDPDSPAGLCFCGCDQCRTISRWVC